MAGPFDTYMLLLTSNERLDDYTLRDLLLFQTRPNTASECTVILPSLRNTEDDRQLNAALLSSAALCGDRISVSNSCTGNFSCETSGLENGLNIQPCEQFYATNRPRELTPTSASPCDQSRREAELCDAQVDSVDQKDGGINFSIENNLRRRHSKKNISNDTDHPATESMLCHGSNKFGSSVETFRPSVDNNKHCLISDKGMNTGLMLASIIYLNAHLAGCCIKTVKSSPVFAARFLCHAESKHGRRLECRRKRVQVYTSQMGIEDSTDLISTKQNSAKISENLIDTTTATASVSAHTTTPVNNTAMLTSPDAMTSFALTRSQINQCASLMVQVDISSELHHVTSPLSADATAYETHRHVSLRRKNAMRAAFALNAVAKSLHQYEVPVGSLGNTTRVICVLLRYPDTVWIDFAWYYRLEQLIVKQALLDDALNWLSTLGGAYSALGDYFSHHAENAARISCRQLRIAMEMGCPVTITRCHLYIALSLMQRGSLRAAKHIIWSEYRKAKGMVVVDTRLLAMCRGLWSRLQYLYKTSRQQRHVSKQIELQS